MTKQNSEEKRGQRVGLSETAPAPLDQRRLVLVRDGKDEPAETEKPQRPVLAVVQ